MPIDESRWQTSWEWYEVRDAKNTGAEYDTFREALQEMSEHWQVKYPEFGPYRIVKCQRREAQVADADGAIARDWRNELVSENLRLRAKIRALTCEQCGGTGRKVVGEHETLTGEFVTDYADCHHGAADAY